MLLIMEKEKRAILIILNVNRLLVEGVDVDT
jgi:hypothetical protein